jgi:two-component system C4-dicarboxylate transport response regulator DctD
MSGTVLFISPHQADAGALAEMLAATPLSLDNTPDIQEAREKLLRGSYGVILTEGQLPDGTWKDVLELTSEVGVFPAVIVTSRLADDRLWAEVLSLGAYDFLAQPFDAGEVRRILANACAQGPTRHGKAQATAAAR